MTEKIAITNYFDFIRWHNKYSCSIYFNMDRHGFRVLQEVEADVVKAGGKVKKDRWETSREIVETLLPIYGDTFKQFVIYRRQGSFGIPVVTVFGK